MSKIRIQRSILTGVRPTPTAAADIGEISANLIDRKLFVRDGAGAPVQIAMSLLVYDDTRMYLVGDNVYESNVLYRCVVDTGPGPFVPVDWQAAGAATSINAVITDPAAAGRNTIVTTGAVEGLVLLGDVGQTADLLVIPGTQSGDTVGSSIDAQSFPKGHFAPTTRRVAQVGHALANTPGLALAYVAGTGFVAANQSTVGVVIVGILEMVIDNNTFVVRTAGESQRLNAGAFEGGTITAGTSYYLSAANAGRLTVTPPTVGQVIPVLYTTSTTSGVVFPGGGLVAAGSFVKTTGDTMTGSLSMSDANQIRFKNASQRFQGHASLPIIDAYIGNILSYRFEEKGTTAPNSVSIMSREKADLRYYQKSEQDGRFVNVTGDTMTGQLTRLNNSTTSARIRMQNTAGFFDIGAFDNRGLFWINNATAAHLDAAGTTVPSSLTLMTREKADNRYVLETGDTMRGRLTLDNTADTNSLSALRFSRPGVQNVQFTLHSGGDLYVNINGTPGGGALAAGIFEAADDTSLNSEHTLVTRRRGDARYLRTANAPSVPDDILYATYNASSNSVVRSKGITVTRNSTGRFTVNITGSGNNRYCAQLTCSSIASSTPGGTNSRMYATIDDGSLNQSNFKCSVVDAAGTPRNPTRLMITVMF